MSKTHNSQRLMLTILLVTLTGCREPEQEVAHEDSATHKHAAPCLGSAFAADRGSVYMQCDDGSAWKAYADTSNPKSCVVRVVAPMEGTTK